VVLNYVKHKDFWEARENLLPSKPLTAAEREYSNALAKNNCYKSISINIPEHLRHGYCGHPDHRGYIPKNIYLKRFCDECDHYKKG